VGSLRRWRDNHERRARRRRRSEEIISWICVPLILFLGMLIWRELDQAMLASLPKDAVVPGRPAIAAQQPR
jgi:hypothetical protein